MQWQWQHIRNTKQDDTWQCLFGGGPTSTENEKQPSRRRVCSADSARARASLSLPSLPHSYSSSLSSRPPHHGKRVNFPHRGHLSKSPWKRTALNIFYAEIRFYSFNSKIVRDLNYGDVKKFSTVIFSFLASKKRIVENTCKWKNKMYDIEVQ